MAKIVDTIRALLAKAAGTDNEHEAEIFLMKAHELMEKHQLDASDLEHDDPVDKTYAYRTNNPDGVDWDSMLMHGVARYYGCKSIRICDEENGKTFYQVGLVGRESARITCIEMHAYLVATVRKLGREAAKNETMKQVKKHPYREGMFYWTGKYLNASQAARRIGHALNIRLKALAREQEAKDSNQPSTAAGKNALITIDRVLAVYKEAFPDATDIKGPGVKTSANAREIAAGIGLNHQVNGGGTLQIEGK